MMNTAKVILVGVAMMCGMASCGNDDNVVTQASGDGPDGLDMKLTYAVGEAQADSVFTRAMAATPETEKQTFMGMEVETTMTEDRAAIRKAAAVSTRATVYNTVDLEGKTVYAFVYDPSTNKTVANMQTLTVTGGKLTVRGKRGCRILFYIGNAPYVSTGADLSTITASQSSTTDPMQCVSDVITSLDQDLGTLTFKHLFAKLRVVLKTSDGTTVDAFSLTTKEKIGYNRASVGILSGDYTPDGTASTKTFSVLGNTTSSAAADYQTIITDNSGTATDLTLVFTTNGKGATIGGAKNWLTSVNNTLKLKSRTFLPGHRYTVNITVKPANTEKYLNSGFRADKNFYQWDAYEPYGIGDSHTWSAGNSGIHQVPSNGGNQNIATQSCKNCPSADEVKMYLGAGAIIDDGHTGAYQQSYITTNPYNGEKITCHEGVWLKRKKYIAGFDSGTAPKATTATVTNGRPPAENIEQYFFLPFYGFYDYTNGSANLYRAWSVAGYYMSRTANSTGYAYYLMANATTVRFGTALNWTSNNICSTNIWSVD